MEEKRVWSIQRYKPRQIVTMLRQIDLSMANEITTPQVGKEAGITVQKFHRWRKEWGGLKVNIYHGAYTSLKRAISSSKSSLCPLRRVGKLR